MKWQRALEMKKLVKKQILVPYGNCRVFTYNNILLELMNHVSEMIAETIGESRRIILYGEQTTSERLIEEHQVII